jgi:hypothetical protein
MMSTSPSEEQWARLARAARRAGPPRPPQEPDGEEIRTRFHGMTETIRGMFLLALWKRWALLAVVLGLLAYAAVFLVLGRQNASAPDQPAISLPVPP